MVITGLTRNQLGSNPTRVRIPPSPPKRTPPIRAVSFLATEGFEEAGIAAGEAKNMPATYFLGRGRIHSLMNAPGTGVGIRLSYDRKRNTAHPGGVLFGNGGIRRGRHRRRRGKKHSVLLKYPLLQIGNLCTIRKKNIIYIFQNNRCISKQMIGVPITAPAMEDIAAPVLHHSEELILKIIFKHG